MKLYTYFRSSAAYRARIALNLKGITTEQVSIHLTKDGGKQHSPEYRAINPQRRVPSLVLDDGTILMQSPAILEYLDEIHPNPPFLPKSPLLFETLRTAHTVLAYLFFVTFLAHLGGVLFHAVVLRDGIIARMAPFRAKPRPTSSETANVTTVV